ncbi:MAG: caspase family protein [Microscillaceae bacterium]|nr:caspase family protein [Microscillaceae bacterium]
MEETYSHHLLYARILLRQNKTTLARQAAQSAYNLARKQKSPGLEAQEMLAQIDRESADKTPPQIRIYSPLVAARGVIVVEATDKITVIGQASDESGIAQVMINGNPARLSADGNFDGETILIQEKNLITFGPWIRAAMKMMLTFSVDKKTEAVAQTLPINTEIYPAQEGGAAVHRALLFASNHYDYWDPLLNPIKDAQTIARELETIYGFKVEVLTDLLKDDVMIKIKEYARKQYGPNDQLFIFFAGHGQFDDIFKEGYVVARDSRNEDESKSSYISHSNLRTYINSIPCKHILLVMDVCFGGTIDPLIALRGQETNFDRDRDELINRKMRYVTRRYLTSGGKEYVPDGRPGQHSPFARQLLEALRSEGGSDGVLTLSEIIRYLEAITPQPRYGEFGLNEPGSDFLFIAH